MLIGRHIAPILIVAGIITALPVLQFFFPRLMLKRLSGVALEDPAALFFARHWGLLTLTVGALVVFAAYVPEARVGIVAAVTVEKLGYAGLVFAHWQRFPGMRAAGLFDTICSLVFSAFLLGL